MPFSSPSRGLFILAPGSVILMTGLRMFDQAELAQLIGGENTLIDMDDLREHSVVSGYPNDKTIKAFWKVRRVPKRYLTVMADEIGRQVLQPRTEAKFDQICDELCTTSSVRHISSLVHM
jgi:hypothetical protein